MRRVLDLLRPQNIHQTRTTTTPSRMLVGNMERGKVLVTYETESAGVLCLNKLPPLLSLPLPPWQCSWLVEQNLTFNLP